MTHNEKRLSVEEWLEELYDELWEESKINLIIEKGFTEDQDMLTPFGLKLQTTYDEIYYQNENI